MGFFEKIKNGLKKTRAAMANTLGGIFASFSGANEEFYEELEESMILADIGVETSCKAVEQLRTVVKERKLRTAEEIHDALKDILVDMLNVGDTSLKLGTHPSVVLVIGVNGVGKTTTIGKLAHRLSGEGKRVLLCAADTFRAAAADQLEIWAGRANVDIVRQHEGADPAAVVFDAISAAKARGSDVILCDTAGRLHNKANLMNELGKISRIIDRELPNADKEVLLVLDGTTGQNGLLQAKQFKEIAGVTAIALTKLDGTAKGGIAVAVSHELGLPILRVGVGEGIEDLQPFEPREYAEALFGEMRDEVEGKDESVPVVDTCPGTGEGRLEDVEEAPEVETDDELVEAEPEEELAEAETEPETDDEEYEDGVEIWLEVDDGSEDDEVDEFEDEPAFDEGDADDEIDAEPVDEDDSEPAKESFRDKMRRWFS